MCMFISNMSKDLLTPPYHFFHRFLFDIPSEVVLIDFQVCFKFLERFGDRHIDSGALYTM